MEGMGSHRASGKRSQQPTSCDDRERGVSQREADNGANFLVVSLTGESLVSRHPKVVGMQDVNQRATFVRAK